MNLPTHTIGDNVLFSKGTTMSVANGRNEMVDTAPAMITVAGIVMHNGEWHYHDVFSPSVLYPESAIVS